MLNNLDRLRAEHAEILSITAEIKHLLNPADVKAKLPLFHELIATLTRRTLAHLLLEDRCLYQEMLLSSYDDTRRLAQEYSDCMGNIASSLKEYANAWESSELILSHPEEFCKATRRMLEILESRINREEQMLYPMAEMAS